MAQCAIALGGNIGDTSATISSAYRLLAANDVRILNHSEVVKSQPMGEAAGNAFLNAAAIVETNQSAVEMLATLHNVELQLGRKRNVHWGPRTIDLDLLLFDQHVIDIETLVVPHPGLWQRRFVLEPLNEIAADWQHPTLQESVGSLFQRIKQRPLSFEIDGLSTLGLDATEVLHKADDLIERGTIQLTEATSAKTAVTCFARVDVQERLDSKVDGRTQPHHSAGRVIDVQVKGAHDVSGLMTSLRNVFSAALG